MIEMAPKALRFARLAAQQQSAFSESPQIEIIEQCEARLRNTGDKDRARKYLDVSRETAVFCLRAVESLLEQDDRFDGAEWDGNDFAFMQAFVRDLNRQLGLSDARAV